MGKLDSIMKCAQARILINEKQHRKALEVIEQMDLSKVKSITDLKTAAEVYMKNEQYISARDIYFRLYDKVQSKSVLYSLIYLCVKCNCIEEAEDFYQEYLESKNQDVNRLILKYYIEKAKGASRKELIGYLEAIKSEEYIEEWAYELAKMYHKEGMEEACVEECSNIILWFGDGIIVEKAMLLKLHYVDGLDISNPENIEETRNIAAELRIAAQIADRMEREELHSSELCSKGENQPEIENESEAEQGFEEKTEYDVAAESEYEEKTGYNAQVEAGYEVDGGQEIEARIESESALEVGQNGTLKADFKDGWEPEYPSMDIDEIFDNLNESIPEPMKATMTIQEVEAQLVQQEEHPSEPEAESQKTARPEIEGAEVSSEELKPEELKMEKMLRRIVKEAADLKELPHFCILGQEEERIQWVMKKLTKELCTREILREPKIARISAEKLNSISLETKKEQLEGSLLLVEDAHKLSNDSIWDLCQIMKRSKFDLILVLADKEEQMKKIMGRNRRLKSLIKYELYV